MKETFNKILFPLNVLMTAIGLVNLGKDIFPAFIKWNEFVIYALDFVKAIRDFVLIPISFPLHLFNLDLFGWFKSYLFIGLLTYNTYNFSHRIICKSVSHASLRNLIFGKDRIRVFLHILITIILWPIFTFELVKFYAEGKQINKNNVYTLWGKYIFWVIISTILLMFTNWTINQIS